jgi:hypothetical protein
MAKVMRLTVKHNQDPSLLDIEADITFMANAREGAATVTCSIKSEGDPGFVEIEKRVIEAVLQMTHQRSIID